MNHHLSTVPSRSRTSSHINLVHNHYPQSYHIWHSIPYESSTSSSTIPFKLGIPSLIHSPITSGAVFIQRRIQIQNPNPSPTHNPITSGTTLHMNPVPHHPQSHSNPIQSHPVQYSSRAGFKSRIQIHHAPSILFKSATPLLANSPIYVLTSSISKFVYCMTVKYIITSPLLNSYPVHHHSHTVPFTSGTSSLAH